MKKVNIIGQVFGKLRVIRKDSDFYFPSGSHSEKYLCECECGNLVVVGRKNLLSGNSKSCGCQRLDASVRRLTTHGGKHSRLYNIWCAMKDRCYRSSNHVYKDYGGRGIYVCEEWKSDFSNFRDWAMNNGYNDHLTIDRIDVNGIYEPSNCRWADMNVQANNRRNSIRIEYNGECHSIPEWSKITGISYDTIHGRYSAGMSVEDILSPHKHKTGPKKKNLHNNTNYA